MHRYSSPCCTPSRVGTIDTEDKIQQYRFLGFSPLYSSDETSKTRRRPHLESDSDIEKNWPRFIIAECLSEGPGLTNGHLLPFQRLLTQLLVEQKTLRNFDLDSHLLRLTNQCSLENYSKLTFSLTSISKLMLTGA